MDFEHIVSVMLHYNYYCKQIIHPIDHVSAAHPPSHLKKKTQERTNTGIFSLFTSPLAKMDQITSLVSSNMFFHYAIEFFRYASTGHVQFSNISTYIMQHHVSETENFLHVKHTVQLFHWITFLL